MRHNLALILFLWMFLLVVVNCSNMANTEYYITDNELPKLDSNISSNHKKMSTSIPQIPTTSSIESAINMIDLVTMLSTRGNEVYQAATKLASKNGVAMDPITAIPSIIIYGAIKFVSYLVSLFIYFSSLITPWQLDPNAKISFIDLESLHNIDYEIISNSVRSVPERSFRLLDIREEECKSRAMCEIGEQIHSYWPRVATYIRLAVEQLNVNDSNVGSTLRGLGWADCGSVFQDKCPRSPFAKFFQIYTSMQKLFNLSLQRPT